MHVLTQMTVNSVCCCILHLVCSELNSKITKLEEKLVSEQKQSLISREQWRQTNFELEEKLRKSQLEHQNLEAKLAGIVYAYMVICTAGFC